MTGATYQAVRRIAKAVLIGRVLHEQDVTAGNGSVIDWRAVKSGESLLGGADAFDVAQLFVAIVGESAAIECLNRSPLDLPAPARAPLISSWARHVAGCRAIHCGVCAGRRSA